MIKRYLVPILIFMAVSVSAASGQSGPGSNANPFLQEWKTPFGVPPFEQIKNEHFLPALKEGIAQQRKEVEAIANNPKPATFANTFEALDASGQLLSKVGGVFYNLLSSSSSDELRSIAKEVSPLTSALSDDILLNEKLFARIKSIHERRTSLKLNPEQLRLVEETYKNFVRGGANLNAGQKQRLRQINEQLSLLELQFSDNLLKETAAYQLVIDNPADLSGLPQGVVDAAAAQAKAKGQQGKWVFTLAAPSIWPFLTYADNRELRRQILTAYIQRGDNDNANDNKAIVSKIMALRIERAKMLGYGTPAEYVLEQRMAKSPEGVYGLLNQLWIPALNRARAEAKQLQAMIEKDGKDFKLEPWDWRYYAEKVKREQYALDENEVQQYFALDNVREGAFYVANKLYGLKFIERKDLPRYNDEVKAFEVLDRDGSHLGVYYVDYHPREGKQVGAWSNSFRDQHVLGGKDIRPININVCNFTRPSGDRPALLRIEEVETLFHEFGHGLHALLSNIHYASLGNVPRDFVELPSQIMEHWATEPEVLKVYAKHWKTGETIPDELVAKIQKAGKFNQGFTTTEYLAASMLDMDWHTLTDGKEQDVRSFEKASLQKMNLIDEIVPRYRTPYFLHIFSHGYSAGYYSYIWSEVLDTDAFQAFKEKGLFDQETATSFRKNVLEKGGTEDAMKMYVKFRGREPSVEPLLENRGLKQAQ